MSAKLQVNNLRSRKICCFFYCRCLDGLFHHLFLFTVEHKNTPNQAIAQKETLSETSYYLEFIVKEEQVQDWDEKKVLMELKRLLKEKMNNNEIEDWIQVTHNEIIFEKKICV